jgi:hypothetical protein
MCTMQAELQRSHFCPACRACRASRACCVSSAHPCSLWPPSYSSSSRPSAPRCSPHWPASAAFVYVNRDSAAAPRDRDGAAGAGRGGRAPSASGPAGHRDEAPRGGFSSRGRGGAGAARGGRGGGRGGHPSAGGPPREPRERREAAPAKSSADLDAELEAYTKASKA